MGTKLSEIAYNFSVFDLTKNFFIFKLWPIAEVLRFKFFFFLLKNLVKKILHCENYNILYSYFLWFISILLVNKKNLNMIAWAAQVNCFNYERFYNINTQYTVHTNRFYILFELDLTLAENEVSRIITWLFFVIYFLYTRQVLPLMSRF